MVETVVEVLVEVAAAAVAVAEPAAEPPAKGKANKTMPLGAAAAAVGSTYIYSSADLSSVVTVMLVPAACIGCAVIFVLFVTLLRRCCVRFEGHHDLFSFHTIGWQLVGHLQTSAGQYVRRLLLCSVCCIWFL